MKLWVSAILLCLSTQLQAVECNLEGNQMEMNQCAHDDFEVADKDLNKVWTALLDKVGKEDNYVEKLREAQRAWIVFRDAEVAAMFACEDEDVKVCWGSMYPMLYSGAMMDLTTQRTKQLQVYLGEGQNPAVDE